MRSFPERGAMSPARFHTSGAGTLQAPDVHRLLAEARGRPYVRQMTKGPLPSRPPPGASPSEVNHELQMDRIYEELRALARRHRSREGEGATLHTTELVHEAYLRFADVEAVRARGSAYFFGAAAQAMRRVLMDAARRRGAMKRGGDWIRVTLSEEMVALERYATDLLDLDSALHELAREHPRPARVVELRFFGGLSVDDTAETLGVSARTVKGDWALARAWLHDRLSDDEPASAPDAPPGEEEGGL